MLSLLQTLMNVPYEPIPAGTILPVSTWQEALTASVPLGPPALVTAPTEEE